MVSTREDYMTSLQKFLRAGAALAFTAALAVPTLAHAQDAAPAAPKEAPANATPSGCAAFKWPLDAERRAFDSADLAKVASGAARGGWREQAFALALQPDADVAYTLPPAKKRKDAQRFGGLVAFAAPANPGTYQVTLSGEAWIDLVQQGSALKTVDHSGVKDCPGLRKSVRFTVGDAPVVLQISGAPAESIKVAIRPVD